MRKDVRVPQDFGIARGPYWELRAEMAKQERRGDVAVFWEEERREGTTHLALPYVRLRSVEEVTNRAALRMVQAGTMGTASLIAVGIMMWEARWVLACLLGGGSLLFLAAVTLGRLRRHAAGCFEPSCAGCR